MAAISIQTAARRAITRTVTSSLKTNLDNLVTALSPRLLPERAARNKVSQSDMGQAVRTIIEGVTQMLERDYQAIEAHEQILAAERADDAMWRAARDEAIIDLRQTILRLRDAMAASYGEEVARAYGLVGTTPDAPDALITVARNVAQKARAGAPASGESFVSIDFERVAESLEAKAEALANNLSNLDRELRETENALIQRDDAVARWQQHYAPVAGMAEALFRLADMVGQAERVRPTSRRRAGKPEETDLETPVSTPEPAPAPEPASGT